MTIWSWLLAHAFELLRYWEVTLLYMVVIFLVRTYYDFEDYIVSLYEEIQ